MTTLYKYINIEIDAICHYTIFYFTRREILHELGSAVDTCIDFDEPTDKESLASIDLPEDGKTYCRARTYSFDPASDLTSVEHSSPLQTLQSFVDNTKIGG